MQPQSSSVLISKAWDYRVRQHLGTRYNSKDGSFDWDLNMKLHEKGVFEQIQKLLCDVYHPKRSTCFNLCSPPAVWSHPQTPVRPVEGEGRGLRDEGRSLQTEQSKPALVQSVQPGWLLSARCTVLVFNTAQTTNNTSVCVCVCTERQQSGRQRLLGRHRLQSLPRLWN